MNKRLSSEELRRLFPSLIGSESAVYQVERVAPALFPNTDRPDEERIAVSLTFVGTSDEDAPDVVFGLTLGQAGALCDALLDLLDQAALADSE